MTRHIFKGIIFFVFSAQASFAEYKDFLITFPVVTVGHEGVVRAEYNFFEEGTLALEWVEWGGRGRREELSPRERRDAPSRSLKSEGRDLGLMFSKYTQPSLMGGFHYGLGLSYRRMQVERKEEQGSEENQYLAVASGPALSARVGYRYVAEDLGFVVGGFLGAKRFFSQIEDRYEEADHFFPMSAEQKKDLKKKLASFLKIGIEIGWAF